MRHPRWFALHVAVFTGGPFLIAGWLLFVANQSLAVKLLGSTLMICAGLLNLAFARWAYRL